MRPAGAISPEKTLRVVLADDHPIFREGLRSLIGAHSGMSVVGEAKSGEEAIELFRTLRPDVVLMDLRMPGISGRDAIAVIRSQDSSARILVLTTFDGDEDIHQAIAAGAHGYVLKSSGAGELVEAIRAVAAGLRYIPRAVAARMAEHLVRPDLSGRELDVLRLIASGESNKEIGARLGIAEGTVKVHVNNILGKLCVRDRTEAATTAIRRGIIRLWSTASQPLDRNG
jgi:two-component system NarL family response regulator